MMQTMILITYFHSGKFCGVIDHGVVWKTCIKDKDSNDVFDDSIIDIEGDLEVDGLMG